MFCEVLALPLTASSEQESYGSLWEIIGGIPAVIKSEQRSYLGLLSWKEKKENLRLA